MSHSPFPKNSIATLQKVVFDRRLELGDLFKRLSISISNGDLEIDCRSIGAGDSKHIGVLTLLQKQAKLSGHNLYLSEVSNQLSLVLKSVHVLQAPKISTKPFNILLSLGESAFDLKNNLLAMTSLFVESIYWSTLGKADRLALKSNDAILQMVRLGSDSFPIVFILSFLIGLTLSYQSAIQLESLGGSIYLVRGIAISMFSEVGPLITAILIAGRSGSSIAAEISSMVIQDEVKSLKVMGINPVQFLVVPRFIALTLTTPILTFASVCAGILAGFFVASFYLQMPVELFMSELQEGLPLKLIWQCAVKSIVFGWIIAVVACNKGLNAQGGADSVGKATTHTVVFSITAIIIMDAVFSFLFY